MKKLIGRNKSQHALLNDLKGALFEFKVAHFLSKHWQLEDEFLNSIPKMFQTLLAEQERILRVHYPEQLPIIMIHSLHLSELIIKNEPQKVSKIYLIGELQDQGSEGDISYEVAGKMKWISLKLTKSKSFINTKSAGVKSFIFEYFHVFKTAKNDQEEFNNIIEEEFKLLSFKMEQSLGLKESDDFSSLKSRGISELPGDLTGQARVLFLEFIRKLKNHLRKVLKSYHQQNPKLFKSCLQLIMGFSHPDQLLGLSLISSMDNVNSKVIAFDECLKQMSSLVWSNSTNDTSFQIDLKEWKLQIRIKPMNKFTSPSYKVNCSVKFN